MKGAEMEYGAKLKAVFVAVPILTGWGCAALTGQWQTVLPQPEARRPSAFAHRMISENVELYWSCSRPTPSRIQVDGIAKNTGKGEVHLLQMELHDVDRRTGDILQSGVAASDTILHSDRFSPFQLDLQPATADGRVDLLDAYRITSIGIIKTTYMDKEFTARDVCSLTQHPNPVSSQ